LGLGFGVCAPNPHTPIPNPQSPIPMKTKIVFLIENLKINNLKIKNNIHQKINKKNKLKN